MVSQIFFCLQQVKSPSSCLYKWWILFTPVASWRRALRWSIDPCRAVAAAFAGLAPGQMRSLWLVVLRQSGLGNVQHHGWPGSTVEGGSFSKGSVYQQPRVWASGAGQQWVDNPRPLSLSFPSHFMGTCHSPNRQSRAGFGEGLLKSRWGEAKSWDVISCKGGSQILSGVGLGRLIKPPDFRVVLARCGSWILIGRWDRKLCQRRWGEAVGMLHWGTPHLLAAIGCWPGLGRSPVSWILIGWPRRRGREVSLAGCWITIGCARSLPPSSSSRFLASWWLGRSSWRRH